MVALDRLVHVAHLGHRDRRAERLLLHRQRVLRYVDQDGRLHEPLAHRVGAADQRTAAAVQRVLMCERMMSSWLGIVIGPSCEPGPSSAETPRLDDQSFEELVVHPLVHVDPLHAGAGLTRVGAGAPQRGVGGGLDVGVLVDDQRVLAAGLDDHRGQGLGAGRHHLLAGLGRAGEGHLVHAGAAQRGARLAEPGHHLQHRSPHRLEERPGQPLPDAGGVLDGLKTTALPAASA